MKKEPRRLTVLQPRDEETSDRAPWQWVLFTTVNVLMGWLVTAAIVQRLLNRTSISASWTAAAHLLVLALVSFIVAILVGRFGGRASAREAVLGGTIPPIVSWLLVALPATQSKGLLLPLLLLLVVFGSGSSYLGARVGIRLRKKQA